MAILWLAGNTYRVEVVSFIKNRRSQEFGACSSFLTACEVTPWSSFGPCSLSSDGRALRKCQRIRTRQVKREGRNCPALFEYMQCRPQDCAWKVWLQEAQEERVALQNMLNDIQQMKRETKRQRLPYFEDVWFLLKLENFTSLPLDRLWMGLWTLGKIDLKLWWWCVSENQQREQQSFYFECTHTAGWVW